MRRRVHEQAQSTMRERAGGDGARRIGRDGDRRARLALRGASARGAALLVGAGAARAATYKWVDEKGVVHYTDKMPPEAVDKASVELNKQGVPVKKTDQALTPEQRRASEQEAERAARRPRRRSEEIARRDRALAAVVHERGRDRPRAQPRRCRRSTTSDPVGAGVTASSSTSARPTSRPRRPSSAASRWSPCSTASSRASTPSSRRQADLIAQKQQRDRRRSPRKYDADKQRWRELVAAKAATKAAAAAARRSAGTRGRPGGAAPPRSSRRYRRLRRRPARRPGAAGPRRHRGPRACIAVRGPPLARPAIIAALRSSDSAGNPWLNTFTR